MHVAKPPSTSCRSRLARILPEASTDTRISSNRLTPEMSSRMIGSVYGSLTASIPRAIEHGR